MLRIWPFLLILLLIFTPLFSQEEIFEGEVQESEVQQSEAQESEAQPIEDWDGGLWYSEEEDKDEDWDDEDEFDDRPILPPIETDWYNYQTSLYSRGDRTFNMTLGVVFPTYFSGIDQERGMGLSLGGTGTLGFSYFLTSNIFLGGELTGMFSFSRMGNTLFIVPFGARVGYQFVYRRLEIPISLFVGMAPQLYLNESYFGWLVLRPGVSFFWRQSADWSFGLNGIWWFVPQWPREGPNVYGNFLELTLSARYHF